MGKCKLCGETIKSHYDSNTHSFVKPKYFHSYCLSKVEKERKVTRIKEIIESGDIHLLDLCCEDSKFALQKYSK